LAKTKSLLYQKIPIRLNNGDTSIIVNRGIDFVEHWGDKEKPQGFLSY